MQMAKEKKKLNVHIKNFFLTIVLLFVLFLTLVGSTVFFDMLGIINFSKIVKRESALGKLPYIGRYVEYSYYQHLTEEERIKETMNKYQTVLEERSKQLDLKEKDIALRETELKQLQTKLKESETSIREREDKLKAYELQVNTLAQEYQATQKNIDKFAQVYSTMKPEAVAKIALRSDLGTIARIFEKMDNKKIGLILDSMAIEDPKKVTDLIDLMTKKGKV